MDAEQSTALLSWTDILKLVIGFMSSAALIWMGVLVRNHFRKKALKKSVWNVLKKQTSMNSFMDALRKTCAAAADGNAYVISLDIS